ncbi:MAG: hypothetical protein WBQ23_15595 [Bacteroidota bacterium]
MAAAGKTKKKSSDAGTVKSSPQIRTAAEPLTVAARAMLAAIAFFLILRGLVSLWHPLGSRLWGIDFPAWLDASPLMHAALWLPLLFLIPQVSGLFTSGWKSSATSEKTNGRRMLWATALTLGAGAFAYWVQIAYAFLGDGTWYVAELYRSMTLPDFANSMIKPSAWLTGILLDGFARTVHPTDIRLPFILAGVAGILIAAAAVLFSTRREKTSNVWITALLFLGADGTLLFLGYIELYALVYALSIAYLVTAWQCLRGHAPIWLPLLLFILAVLFGASAIVWLPSLLLLLHWKVRGEEGALPLRRAAVALMLLPLGGVALLYVLGAAAGDSAYLVALTPYERVVEGLRTGWQSYVLLAPERWADIGNMLLLGLGPVIFVIPLLLGTGRRNAILRRPAVLFGATAAAGGVTLLLFGNTFLGLARDWDVGAFALLGVLMLALALWTESDGSAWQRAVLPALAAAILSQLLLWISVNTQDRASAERFEEIAAMDAGLLLPMNTFTAYENLRKFYQSGGDSPAYFRILRLQIETGYRSHIGYAEYLSSALQLRDPAQRRVELGWLCDAYLRQVSQGGAPDNFLTISTKDAREFVARLLLSAWQVGERELTQRYEASFRPLFPDWPELGLLTVLRGEGGGVEDELQRIRSAVTDQTKDAFLHMTAGGLYQQRGEYPAAARAYDAALQREPAMYPSWYLVAADLHLKMTGDTGAARRLLEACIQNAGSSQEASSARELLLQL